MISAVISLVYLEGGAYANEDITGEPWFILSEEFTTAGFKPEVGDRVILERRPGSKGRWLVGLSVE